jgi:hypothetical protein
MASDVWPAVSRLPSDFTPRLETGGKETGNSQGRLMQFATSRSEVRRYLEVHSAVECTGDRLTRQRVLERTRCAPARSWSGLCGASPFSGQTGLVGSAPYFACRRFRPSEWPVCLFTSPRIGLGDWLKTATAKFPPGLAPALPRTPCAVKASCPCRVRVFRGADWAGSWGSRAEEPRYSQIACFHDEFPGQMCSSRPIERPDKSHWAT